MNVQQLAATKPWPIEFPSREAWEVALQLFQSKFDLSSLVKNEQAAWTLYQIIGYSMGAYFRNIATQPVIEGIMTEDAHRQKAIDYMAKAASAPTYAAAAADETQGPWLAILTIALPLMIDIFKKWISK